MTDPVLGPGLAAALGALQGVAEFLPISSSGHLALAERWFGVDPAAAGHSFNIVVHAGTLVAVLLFYREDLRALLRAVFQRRQVQLQHHQHVANEPDEPLALAEDLGKPQGNGLADRSGLRSAPLLDVVPNRVGPPINTARALLLGLIVATLPLALALTDTAEYVVLTAEGSTHYIAAGFLLTAVLLAFSHSRTDISVLEAPRPWQALVIGLSQLVAILPGISRSGSTMAAAMALGLGRLAAARFSFLLSIPAILGASFKETIELWRHGAGAEIDPAAFALGFATSFAVGTLTLRALMTLLVRVGLLPFVPYLLLLGLVVFIFG
ncbi:MAG: undecaprenyl-diphosphate phosphatase [Nannocystis sp.]|nr:undecaprenyl-diphosphate phosphatase [Nannocystis sp.]MBA3545276.1 undecaprenyl-diphosphate phosphatase [Nannocystis sp.]